jgi:homopolymeric O-antigen transport system ATP-binding protein
MSDIAIRVEGLGKEYRIGKRERYKTLRDTLTDTVSVPFRWARSLAGGGRADETPSELFWALRDVAFEIPQGSVVGVIGRNGAGKSTLLKILSRITEPTEGHVEIHGRVGSLLEVGTGFHPELTGRENVFLNGAILGMRRAEITRKFDEIIAFAEIDKFVDTPVKHYSSGMYTRLAFAVAAHLEPEILIVDEVLAVGDAQFQKKCLGKMGEVAKEGRTVLFVSHNMVAVSSLCTYAMCLSAGRLINEGNTAAVVSGYLNQDARPSSGALWDDPATAPGNGMCRLHEVRVRSDGADFDRFPLGQRVDVEVSYRNYVEDALLNVSLFLYSSDRICIFNSISPPCKRPAGLVREVCEIPADFLNTAVYRIGVMVVRDTGTILVHRPDVVSFETFETDRSVTWYGEWEGLIRPALSWRARVEPAAVELALSS